MHSGTVPTMVTGRNQIIKISGIHATMCKVVLTLVNAIETLGLLGLCLRGTVCVRSSPLVELRMNKFSLDWVASRSLEIVTAAKGRKLTCICVQGSILARIVGVFHCAQTGEEDTGRYGDGRCRIR